MSDLFMSELTTVASFDYGLLAPELQGTAQLSANIIKDRMRRTAQDIIEIGKELIKMKEILPHGQFLPWLKAEFGMSDQGAKNLMNVATRFSQNPNNLDFAPTVLYALAAPSTPDEVVEKAVELAQSGEKVKLSTVRELQRQTAEEKAQNEYLREKVDRVEGIRIEERKNLLAELEKLRSQLDEKPHQVVVEKVVQAPPDTTALKEIQAKIAEKEAELKKLEQRKERNKTAIDEQGRQVSSLTQKVGDLMKQQAQLITADTLPKGRIAVDEMFSALLLLNERADRACSAIQTHGLAGVDEMTSIRLRARADELQAKLHDIANLLKGTPVTSMRTIDAEEVIDV